MALHHVGVHVQQVSEPGGEVLVEGDVRGGRLPAAALHHAGVHAQQVSVPRGQVLVKGGVHAQPVRHLGQGATGK